MIKIYEIVRKYFPNASSEYANLIIAEKTGWPSFWNIPEDGNTPQECFETQVFWYSWVVKKGMEVCMGCGKAMKISSPKKGLVIDMCPKCQRHWDDR